MIKLFAAALLLLVILPGRADAVFVELFASGDNEVVSLSNGLDADVNAIARTIPLNLDFNVPQTITLNDVDFDTLLVSAATGADTHSQTLFVNTPASDPTSRGFSQSISVVITNEIFVGPRGNVTLGGSSPLVFDLSGMILTVTPLGGSVSDVSSTPTTFSNQAEVVLTPEPSSLACIMLSGAALLSRRRASSRA
jgi:hypothetical protein